MDIEFYAILKDECKGKISAKTKKHFYGGKPNGEGVEYSIGLTLVRIKQGIVESEVPVDGEISQEIEPYVASFRAVQVMHDKKPGLRNGTDPRAHGRYHLPDDEQTIGRVDFFMNGCDKVTCYGPDRDKVIKLFEMIRAGTIRPTDEWGNTQVKGGPDYVADLEAEIKILRGRAAVQEDIYNGLEDKLETMIKDYRNLRDLLSNLPWPFISRKRMLTVLANISKVND